MAVLVLFFLACPGHARRIHTTNNQLGNDSYEDRLISQNANDMQPMPHRAAETKYSESHVQGIPNRLESHAQGVPNRLVPFLLAYSASVAANFRSSGRSPVNRIPAVAHPTLMTAPAARRQPRALLAQWPLIANKSRCRAPHCQDGLTPQEANNGRFVSHEIRLRPGTPGAAIEIDTGRIAIVNQGGQMALAGVMPGWIISKVDGRPYSNDLRMACVNGDRDYTLTLLEDSVVLPDGWTENTDASSGRKFYYNARSGESTWDQPKRATTTPLTGTPLTGLATLPDGWAENTDASSGRKFYYNAGSGESTWDRPKAAITTPSTGTALTGLATLPDGWDENVDSSSGRKFYYNVATGETTWDRPGSLSGFYAAGSLSGTYASSGKLGKLGEDVAAFRKEAAVSIEAEPTLLQRTIDFLGTVLTYNFFIIISFFLWFLSGVAGQYILKSFFIINAFRSCWDVLILPLLTTHMTLTFLSWGLEKLSGAEKA